jgi:tetratricopeptide (TPR) repeat protein
MHPPNHVKSIRVTVCAALGLTVLVGCATSPAQIRSEIQVPRDGRGVVSINGEQLPVDLRDPYERGKAYLMAGQFGLAVRTFRAALQDEPTSVRTLNAIAATYDRMHRFDLAERYYMKALALDPESVQTLNNIGYSYVLQGRAQLALEYLQRSLNLARSNETVLSNVAAAQDILVAPGDRRPRSGETSVAAMSEYRSAPKGAIWIERTTARVQTLFTRSAPDASEGVAPLSGEEAAGGEVAKAVPLVPVEVRDLPPPEAEAQRAQTDAPSAEATAEATASDAPEELIQVADVQPDRAHQEPSFGRDADAPLVAAAGTGAHIAAPGPSAPGADAFDEGEPVLTGTSDEAAAPEFTAEEPPERIGPLHAATAESGGDAASSGLTRLVKKLFRADRSRVEGNVPAGASFAELTGAAARGHSAPAPEPVTVAALPKDALEQTGGLAAERAVELGLDAREPGEKSTARFGDNPLGGLAYWFWDQIATVFTGFMSTWSHVASSSGPVYDGEDAGVAVLLGPAAHGSDAVPAWLRPKGQIDVSTMLASPSLRDHYRQAVDPVRSALEEEARDLSDLAERSVMVALGQPDLPSVATETFVDGGQALPAGGKVAIEVANGTGRDDMAARLRLYFQANGIEVGQLTNDESFSNGQSVVYYRPGFEDDVEFLVALLPVDVKRRPDKDLTTDIRLLLGKDLLPFDRFLTSLFEVGANATSA